MEVQAGFSLFLWIAGGFVLGAIFPGYVAWKRGIDGKGWLWWRYPKVTL